MKNKIMILVFGFLTSVVCFAEEMSTNLEVEKVSGGSWMNGLMSNAPLNTIGWVLAVLALLNGLSMGLEKMVALTETKADDKVLGALKKVLSFAKVVIDFVTAKGSTKK